jgi:hypothetical protein
MIRILACSLFLISCAQVPIMEPPEVSYVNDNFIIVSTMCDLPVKALYEINGVKDGHDINPYDEYEMMNLKTFLTAFDADSVYESPMNRALLTVARIKCGI